jgi:ABC-type phosphate transport system permease subunit
LNIIFTNPKKVAGPGIETVLSILIKGLYSSLSNVGYDFTGDSLHLALVILKVELVPPILSVEEHVFRVVHNLIFAPLIEVEDILSGLRAPPLL